MKTKFTDEVRNIFADGREWIRLEVEYARLTIAEKATMLLSSLILGAVCLLIFIVALIMISLCLVEVFELFLAPVYAYLCVIGILLILMLLVFLLRKPLLLDPIARLISKTFLEIKPTEEK